MEQILKSKIPMKDFIEKLKAYDKTFDKDDLYNLGFYPSVTDTVKYELLKKGWWSIYHIFSERYCSYGLNIQPGVNFKDWYVMEMSESCNSCATFAPGIMNFWYFNQLDYMLILKGFNAYKDKYLDKEKISLPFLESFHMEKEYAYFRDYFLNKSIIPDSQENIDKIYLHFWNYFDKSKGHEVLRKIITAFNNNKDATITELNTADLGHWATRILYIVVNRSLRSIINLKGKPELETLFWKLFTSTLNYDAEDGDPKHIGNSIRHPKFELRSMINYLASASYTHSEYIKNSPLFAALLKMRENRNTYIGVEHVEAAAIFDEKLNDPIMSWNCLVNAAYWSGTNTNETFLPAWEAAIMLCEREGWADAYEALTLQYKFYKDYKKKNNIT
jgi:hypothetical protein